MSRLLTIIIVGIMHIINVHGADISVSGKDVSCNGTSDGEIEVTVENVDVEYTLKLSHLDRNGLIDMKRFYTDSIFVFSGLQAGNYTIELSSNSSVLTDSVIISEPAEFEPGIIEIVSNPNSAEDCDGVIKANPAGGTPPYKFKWSDNIKDITSPNVNNLCVGIYKCTMSEANNCGDVSATVFLTLDNRPNTN